MTTWDRHEPPENQQGHGDCLRMRNLGNTQRKQDAADYQKQILKRVRPDRSTFYRQLEQVSTAEPGITDLLKLDGTTTPATEEANVLDACYRLFLLTSDQRSRVDCSGKLD